MFALLISLVLLSLIRCQRDSPKLSTLFFNCCNLFKFSSNSINSVNSLYTIRYRYFLKGSSTMNKNHFISTKFTSGGQDFEFPKLSITDYNI